MKQVKKAIIVAVTMMITIMMSAPILQAAANSTYYWWDKAYFLGSAPTFVYPHPERNYYGINIFSMWGMYGAKLLHFQMDQKTSGGLVGAGPAVIGAAIGAAIGALAGGGIGAIAGAAIGALIGVYLATVGGYILLDESGCMWAWISIAFINWVVNWWWLGAAAIAAAFLLYGYLRVGSLTIYDAVGAGSPSPPSYYVSSITAYGKVGTGSVGNPNNLVGSSNDGKYATLYAGNYGDSAWLTTSMNTAAAGHVYVYGYSVTGTGGGYVSHLVVSVSTNGNSWTTISDQMLSPKSSPYNIDCGSTTSYFSYMKFFVDYHNGYSANVNLDAVHVIDASENIVSSINSQGHSSGGSVNNPNYLIGANDGQYTHLHASNSGDYAWIVGKMNTPAAGHVYVYGYSVTGTGGGYVSHLVVSVSSDGYTWTTLSDQMISPGSSPYNIDCGSTTYSFNYIKFYVDYHYGYSAGLNLDAVHVLS
jgi:hypothetical protein